MVEKIIGIATSLIIPEFITAAIYNLIFTDRRLIVYKASGRDSASVGVAASALGGIAGGVAANTYVLSRDMKKAQEMTIKSNLEEILSKDKRILSIDHIDIDKITLKKRAVKMKFLKRIKTIGKRPTFYFTEKDHHDEIEAILMNALPNITTVK